MLTRLDDLMSWCRMEFQPKKSRSLSIRRGKVDEATTFTVAEQQIPTVSQEPVKSLGRWYDSSMVSADLPEWERHPDVIRKTALKPDIVIHSASTQQIIMVELTVPYESRMEDAHAFKEGKYLDMTKELKKDGYEARVMPVEIGARGFVGSSAYGLLSKLSIGGNKRTIALRLLAETAENSSRWIWSRRKERLLHKD
ncbi:polyprotein [Plakobranchus ocellatus]|uniref:Polyprotein n=1 Tax=Plakobranchus ocellatus TaxID=259542 RepID=A0AAV3ZJD4_9GAST|nr:polyprotein [Plakobranchus ocellatus]